LNRKNQFSPREQLVERVTKTSLVMIKKVNCLKFFESVVKNQLLGILKELPKLFMDSALEKFLIIKCQSARVWAGIVRVTGARNYLSQVADWIDEDTHQAYYEEYMGLKMDGLVYYSVEVVLKSFVPMDQTSQLMVQERG
jgi:hypothetical protein